jgi:hypothetical protein
MDKVQKPNDPSRNKFEFCVGHKEWRSYVAWLPGRMLITQKFSRLVTYSDIWPTDILKQRYWQSVWFIENNLLRSGDRQAACIQGEVDCFIIGGPSSVIL